MVDIIHHTLIGFSGALVAQAAGQTEIAMGFAIGSILPDLDAVFMLGGKSRFLRLHQGPTHSLLVAPILSVIPALALAAGLDLPPFPLWLGIFMGMLLHIGLDCINTFGVMVLWPLPPRVRFDAIFFLDFPAIWLTAAAYGTLTAAPGVSPMAVVSAWLISTAVYVAYRTVLRLRIKRKWGTTTEIPSGTRPNVFFVTKDTDDGVMIGVASGWDSKVIWTDTVKRPDHETLSLCGASCPYPERMSAAGR